MSILQWFNKPKWQSPNEQVRITAIKTSNDPLLLESLLDIVHNDPSDKVKKSALSRLEDLSSLLQVLNQHGSKALRQQAGKKLINLFQSNGSDELMDWLDQIKDPEVIRALAKTASSAAVRKSAISQISQQGLLSELMLSEPEIAIQQQILAQIEQPSTLKRLAKKLVKNQPEIHDLIQQKLSQHQGQDPNTAAVELCQKLEQVVLDKSQQLNLTEVAKQWQTIESQVNNAIKTRFEGAYSAAKMILDPEHRREFLRSQKAQRNRTMLLEISQKLDQTKDLDLPVVQNLISTHQSIDQASLSGTEQTQYEQLKTQLSEARDAIQEAQQIPPNVTQILDQIQGVLKQAVVQPDQLKKFKKRWQQATRSVPSSDAMQVVEQEFNSATLKLAEKIEHSAQQREQAAKQAVSMIEPTLKEIKDGHLIQAKVMANDMAELKKLAGFNHPVIKQNKYQLDSVWQQLKDLRQWQKWSNDQARQDIIDELQSMVGQGQHPDAVLKKLKEVNERWYALEEMEKLPGDRYPSRNQKMWQVFRAVSKSLFEPTQPFFEKRSEHQNARLTDIQDHIKAMQGVDLDTANERELANMSQQAIKHLKSLDELPPKQRGKIAKNLRQAINRIDQKLTEVYDIAARRKVKLIEQAQALHTVEDLEEAINTAKQLQQQWKSAGIVKPHQERKLWKKFRQANDAVFNRRDQEKQALQQANQAQRKAANEFLKAQQKALQKATNLDALNGLRVTTLQGWDELDKPAKMLDHEYNHLLHNIDQAIKQAQFKSILELYAAKQQLDDLYTELELERIDQDQFDERAKGLMDEPMTEFFQHRGHHNDTDVALAELIIQGEFITGIETPESELEARMAYQVKVLSERMAGENTPDNHNQAAAWLDRWYAQPKTDATYLKKNQKRIKQVVKAMTQLMME